jgi:hypothetical protein
MNNGITKQKRRVLLLALYLLKDCGIDRPHKQQVFDFIRQHDLMRIPSEDEGFRKAGEEIWKHDLSWMRNTLKNDGFLRYRERGIWELTDAGERDVKAWAQRMRLLSESKPNWADNFESHSNSDAEYDVELHREFYITETAVRWGIKIAENCKN